MARQPEHIARQLRADDFERIFELCYARLKGMAKSKREAEREFNLIMESEDVLALGIERFEQGTGVLVAIAISALIKKSFATALLDNQDHPDVQAFIARYPGAWLATESEIEAGNLDRGNTMLVLYYRIESPPYCQPEEFQDVRQLLHEKWFQLCGGFRISQVIGELWEEPLFGFVTQPATEGGLGMSVANDYETWKKKSRGIMERRGLRHTPCLIEISNWRDTKDPLLRKFLRYNAPIFGLTPTQKEIMISELGILPLRRVNKDHVHPIRQRIYQRLLNPVFKDTWLGSQLHLLKESGAESGKKAIVDSYFRDHLQELRPYPSFRL